MIRRLALAALLLLAPSPAWSYSFTCNQVVAAAGGSELTQGAVVGYAWGAGDVLAGLLCLVNSPRCFCLSNLVQLRNEQFAENFADEIVACFRSDGNQPAFGAAMRAAQRTCP